MNVEVKECRKTNTEKFLIQYEMRQRLEAVDGGGECRENVSGDERARAECARRVQQFDREIERGQIRVLPKTERVTYVLVAREWSESSWLVIPFSNFSEPATDDELRLQDDGGVGLRVVQLWNARSMTRSTLQKSWVVATMDEKELNDILAAWKWTVGAAELSESQQSRTGLPILERDDKRITYQDRELKNFAEIDAADMRREEWCAKVRINLQSWRRQPLRMSRTFDRNYALAASPVLEPVSVDCEVPGFEVKVHVRYTPEDKALRIEVFGSDGSCSKALDGWSVFAAPEEALGEIENGRFKYTFAEFFDGVVAIADLEGGVFPLISE